MREVNPGWAADFKKLYITISWPEDPTDTFLTPAGDPGGNLPSGEKRVSVIPNFQDPE